MIYKFAIDVDAAAPCPRPRRAGASRQPINSLQILLRLFCGLFRFQIIVSIH